MRNRFIVILIFYLNVATTKADAPEVCIDTLGCIEGIYEPGNEIEKYEAFYGVPFAKPPVDELRFKNPVPVEAWNGTLLAKEPHTECIQRNYILIPLNTIGDEDCLYLNVYRPAVPERTSTKACLKTASLWNDIKKLHLRTNMRASLSKLGSEFPQPVLSIGNGSMQNIDGYVTVDSRIGKVVHSLNDLIYEVYPDIENILSKSYNWLCERAIVSPRNVTVDEINNIAMQKLVEKLHSMLPSTHQHMAIV